MLRKGNALTKLKRSASRKMDPGTHRTIHVSARLAKSGIATRSLASTLHNPKTAAPMEGSTMMANVFAKKECSGVQKKRNALIKLRRSA